MVYYLVKDVVIALFCRSILEHVAVFVRRFAPGVGGYACIICAGS